MAVLGHLLLGLVGEDGLKGEGTKGGRERRDLGSCKFVEGSCRDFLGGEGGDGNNGEVELLDTGVGGNAEVGTHPSPRKMRLGLDGEGGARAKRGDELMFDKLVTGGGEGSEAFAELGVSKVVVESTLRTDLSLARAEGFEVERS